jgi:hypothetical protein
MEVTSMPHPELPREDEATFRTDEQAGTSADQFKRSEKVFDPDHPPTQSGEKDNYHKPTSNQVEQVRTDESQDPSKAVHEADPTDV